jgi:hypothetical protein
MLTRSPIEEISYSIHPLLAQRQKPETFNAGWRGTESAGAGKDYSHSHSLWIALEAAENMAFLLKNPNDFEPLFSLWDFLKTEK